MPKRLNVYSDGGSRGNPGLAAAAYLILTATGTVAKSDSRFLGKRTNNQAEYEALNAALEVAAALGGDEVVCHLDSELVCRQLTGEYKVKNIDLQALWRRTQELKRHFQVVRFVNVPREDRWIREADRLVNERLDRSS
jgi:ribonuclease HI